MFMGVLPTCMSVDKYVWYPQRPEENVGSLEVELQFLLHAMPMLGIDEKTIDKWRRTGGQHGYSSCIILEPI